MDGQRGYHPLLAIAAGFVRGATSCGRLRHAKLTVRADSGFYAHALVVVCREMDVRFSITIRQHARLRELIEAISEGLDARPLLDGPRRRRGRDHLHSLPG